MRMATAIAAVVFALLFCVSAVADIPETISYQGVLRDDAGVPVPDDDYEITFCLYDVETGGTSLWCEVQTLPVEDGVFNAHLGSVVTLTTLDFLVPYWVGISVEGEGELAPRTAFETVPYAAHASFADGLTGEANWEASGDDIYRDHGNVGIGAEPVDARLDVIAGDMIAADFSNGSSGANFTVRVHNAGGNAAGFFANTSPTSFPLGTTAVYAVAGGGARAGQFVSDSEVGVLAITTAGSAALHARNNGSGYSGFFEGGAGILVEGTVETDGFKMPTGGSVGDVLTSDASGVGTWQAPATGSDADWTVSGSDMYATPSGYVGIGTTAPMAKLQVETDVGVTGIHVKHNGAPSRVVNIERTTTAYSNNDILQITAAAGSSDAIQFIECERGGAVEFRVQGDGSVLSSGGASFADDVTIADARLIVTDVAGPVAEMSVSDPTATEVLSVIASDAGGSMDGAAVRGKYVQSLDYGVGGYFEGGWRGVYGAATSSGGSFTHYGVYGIAGGSSGSNYGVYGSGVGGANYYAGYFNGDVHVNGTLTAVTKSFRIDHPLDPANKYLQHSCVESDEMANMYTGNVTLDASGQARVQLPDWFEALNVDFRYQLTAVGAPGPNLYIAKKISGNSFSIAGGDPGMEVSWQVTGVRNDPAARAHGVVVEQDKPASEMGKYLDPAAYGMPLSAGVDYEGTRGDLPRSEPIERVPLELFDPSDGE